MVYKYFIKRIFDFGLSLFFIFLLSPIFFIIIMILFFLHGRKDVFFIQERPGKDKKIFKIMKFKTMNDKKGKDGKLLTDEFRMTKIGQFLRSTSLDEIPQLFNVLLGDMSFIGPRPLLPEYLLLYDEEQNRRHEVLPGITGWAQINGRNTVSWQKRFELDVWYVNNLSFSLDSKIFFLTIMKVLRRQGISSENNVTMERFNGNN